MMACTFELILNIFKYVFDAGTSIVYAATQKHTKVEFPEARIYEETLQVLLYEDRKRIIKFSSKKSG